MNILKIFRKKEEPVEEVVFEKEQPVEPEPSYSEDDLICSQCDMAIHSEQRVKTFAGKKMHMKPCWFKLRKTAKNYMKQ